MNDKASILIIDDEPQIRKLIQLGLGNLGFLVYQAETGDEGLKQLIRHKPDAILLDLILPDTHGLDFLKQIREFSTIPVIVLSVLKAESDIITLLESGADDYITKPFHMGELIARIHVALRHRKSVEQQETFESGSLHVNFTYRTVMVDQNEVKLTPTEYSLLRCFIMNQGKVLTHNQIIQTIWGVDTLTDTNNLRVYINSLRKKIEKDYHHPTLIVNEPSIGYRFSG